MPINQGSKLYLVDTSIWVDHFRSGNETQVVIHPFIIGELLCGNFRNRKKIILYLSNLARCKTATHDEALYFMETQRLYGKGLGWIDIHICCRDISVISKPGFGLGHGVPPRVQYSGLLYAIILSRDRQAAS